MQRSLIVIAALALLVVFASAEEQTLTDATFDAALEKGGDWFLMFYAPWCGHCKNAKPAWAEFGKAAAGQTHVGSVDCTTNSEVCQRFGVRGYPTIKFVSGGKVYDYRGARSVEGWTAFATTGFKDAEGAALPAKGPAAAAPAAAAPAAATAAADSADDGVIALTDETSKQTETGAWFVDIYAPWCGHCKRLAPTWSELAKKVGANGAYKVAKIDATVHKELSTKLGVRGFPTIKFFLNGKVIDYTGARTLEAFESFAADQLAKAGKAEL